jgi:hypothetical protein
MLHYLEIVMSIDLSDNDRSIVRQALLLRIAQLRRAIDREVDADILRIRREQLAYIQVLSDRFVLV